MSLWTVQGRCHPFVPQRACSGEHHATKSIHYKVSRSGAQALTHTSALRLGKQRASTDGRTKSSLCTLDKKLVLEGKNIQRQNNRRSQNGPANRKGRLTRSHILAKILFLSFKRNTSTQNNRRGQLKLNENCQNHPRENKRDAFYLTRADRIEVNYYAYNFLPALTSVFCSSKTTKNSLISFELHFRVLAKFGCSKCGKQTAKCRKH